MGAMRDVVPPAARFRPWPTSPCLCVKKTSILIRCGSSPPGTETRPKPVCGSLVPWPWPRALLEGIPSVRMVLLKGYDERGFVFYTNYNSRKGRELEENRRAALLFYWDPLGRQVRVEGHAERTSAQESASYARSRPRGSQLSALASPQSQVVGSRSELEQRVTDLAELYADTEVPVPDAWGGFRLLPSRFEFWQHREDRLHDRLLYTVGADLGWRLQRLGP